MQIFTFMRGSITVTPAEVCKAPSSSSAPSAAAAAAAAVPALPLSSPTLSPRQPHPVDSPPVLSPVSHPEAVPATAAASAAAAAPPPKTREDLEWVVAGVRALESETDNDTVTEAESETERVSECCRHTRVDFILVRFPTIGRPKVLHGGGYSARL